MHKSLTTEKTIGYWAALSIGIGGMVGGGIFAVLGLAVQLSHGGTPLAFLIAGLVAIVTAYSYSKMSLAFPTKGGTVEFLFRAFGPGIFTGGLNILLWLSYIIMLSLYAYAFGNYGATFFTQNLQPLMKHILMSLVIILFTVLNFFGNKLAGRSEIYIVSLKILILFIFLGVGFKGINTAQLQPSAWSSPLQLIGGGMIIFLAYEGFELIANTAGSIQNPKRNLPLAYYTSVGFVILLYVLISIVTIGNLAVNKIVDAKDYALAEAAKPFLGQAGFILITVAALLSTSSAINATLYGAAKISYVIAKEGELPMFLDRLIWNKPVEGLLITSGATLIVANLFDLSSISMMGSSGFLIIFAMVNLSNFLLNKKTNSSRWIPLLGTVICFGALIILIIQQVNTDPLKIIVLFAMIGIAFLTEVIYRKVTKRTIKSLK